MATANPVWFFVVTCKSQKTRTNDPSRPTTEKPWLEKTIISSPVVDTEANIENSIMKAL
jgi:hypothetical protein